MKLPVYLLSIKDEHAEDGEELGIFEIANTANPAIKMKGIAFSAQDPAPLHFKDDLKYRIAAPVLTPDKIYRCDEETGEESYYKVTAEFVEDAFVKFMGTRMGKQVFNEEHNEAIKPPSFILETWMVEDPKTDKSYTKYGIECPPNTWFAVQQFTDKDVYHDYVDRGLTGFSIHGHSAILQMASQEQTTKDDNMEKPIFILEGKKYYADEEGNLMEVVEETEMAEDSKEETTETVEAAAEETTEETEMAEEKPEEKTDETEMAEETKEEDVAMADESTEEKKEETETAEDGTGEMDYYTKSDIDAMITGVMDVIAEKLAGAEADATDDTEMSTDSNTQMSGEKTWFAQKMEKLEKFASAKQTIANTKNK